MSGRALRMQTKHTAMALEAGKVGGLPRPHATRSPRGGCDGGEHAALPVPTGLVLAAGDHFAARVYALAAAELEAHSRTGPDWAACAKEIVDSNLESNTPFLSVH